MKILLAAALSGLALASVGAQAGSAAAGPPPRHVGPVIGSGPLPPPVSSPHPPYPPGAGPFPWIGHPGCWIFFPGGGTVSLIWCGASSPHR